MANSVLTDRKSKNLMTQNGSHLKVQNGQIWMNGVGNGGLLRSNRQTFKLPSWLEPYCRTQEGPHLTTSLANLRHTLRCLTKRRSIRAARVFLT
jgi:hypothetical protein